MSKKNNQQVKQIQNTPQLNTQEIDKKINAILTSVPIIRWKWPRPLLCILKERAISYADKVFDNIYQIASFGCAPLFMNYTRTDLARNKAGAELLKTNYTHLIMLDIDHRHPVDIVQKLCFWLLWDKFTKAGKNIQVLGGINFRRSAPHDPCAHLFGSDGAIYAPAEWDKGLMEVDAIGTGSILIAREVFETIPPPWFWNPYDNVWNDVWPGEDMGFSRKCREFGIKMYVDTQLTSPHIVEAEIGEREFRACIKRDNLPVRQVDESIQFHHDQKP